ncbi:hypothetical protein PCE1_001937 [Barthelona sp. PCE]
MSTKAVLGKFSSRLKMGIVGLPNVGKSSTFNLFSTSKQSDAQNYPFCTIDPTQAIVQLEDPRFDRLCEIFQPRSRVPASYEIIDIAGLISGAHRNEGLGFKFLDNIANCNGIFNLVRLFPDDDVSHVEGTVDPVRDLEIIADELRLRDLAVVIGMLPQFEKDAHHDVEARKALAIVERVRDALENGQHVRFVDWHENDVETVNSLHLLTAKPSIYLLNMSEHDFLRKKNKHLKRVFQWVQANGGEQIVPFSCSMEQEIIRDPEYEHKDESQLDKILSAGFKCINLISFFTCGADEVRAWNLRSGNGFNTAVNAAGVIHNDLKNSFRSAEIYKYSDIDELGRESEVRAKGLLKTVGRTYLVEDGDCCYFKATLARSGKRK